MQHSKSLGFRDFQNQNKIKKNLYFFLLVKILIIYAEKYKCDFFQKKNPSFV